MTFKITSNNINSVEINKTEKLVKKTEIKESNLKIKSDQLNVQSQSNGLLPKIPLKIDENSSKLDKLYKGNLEALKITKDNLVSGISSPVETITGFVKDITYVVTKPLEMVTSVSETWGTDKVDSVIQGVGLGSLYAGVGSLGFGAGLYMAAPFTSGKSLKLLPLARQIGFKSGTVGFATMGLSFSKNQYDVVNSKNNTEFKKEVKELSYDYTGAAAVGISYGAFTGGSKMFSKTKIAQRLVPQNIERLNRRYGNKYITDKFKSNTKDSKPIKASLELKNQNSINDINKTLNKDYKREIVQVNRKEIPKISDKETITLYHGTKQEYSKLIFKDNFKPGYIGDYGPGVYLTNSIESSVNYADGQAHLAILKGKKVKPALVVSEVEVGRVLDFNKNKNHYLEWAKSKFNPADMTDEVNVLYKNSETQLSPFVDTKWNRFLPRYMEEFKFDTILIKGQEGIGHDYWVIPNKSRVNISQEVILNQSKATLNPISENIVAAGIKKAVLKHLSVISLNDDNKKSI